MEKCYLLRLFTENEEYLKNDKFADEIRPPSQEKFSTRSNEIVLNILQEMC